MTQGRFNLLSEVIACCDPRKGPHQIRSGQQWWAYMKAHPMYMYTVEKIWDTVVGNCLDNWSPGQELALDEGMVKYKGSKANVKRFFMPLKPIKMGFKIYMYAVCESSSGYLLNMMVHADSGQKMKDISMKIMEPFLDRFHQLYCDKLYTSPALAAALLERKTYICGAVKRSSRGLPDDFSINPSINPSNYKKMLELKKAPRGTMYFRQKEKMTVVLWRDTKVVSLLSTCHQAHRDKTSDFLSRNMKDQGERKATKKSVRAPPQAVAYTKNMGGVDRHDQLRAYQTCSRQAMKWWRKLLYFLVDVSRVNAWLCYKHNTDQLSHNKLSHRKFTVALIGSFAEGTPVYQPLNLSAVPLINGPRHQLVRMPSKFGRWCIQCRREGKRTPSNKGIITRTGCMSCNVHLHVCRGQCFLVFHSADGVHVN